MTFERPQRLVLDPNVLISAAITPAGSLGRLASLVDVGMVIPVVSQHLLDEISEVLARPKMRAYIDAAGAVAYVAELGRLAEWHSDPVNPPSVVRDVEDDYLIALALAAKVDALVSGDRDLHALHDPGVEILLPRQLLERHDDSSRW